MLYNYFNDGGYIGIIFLSFLMCIMAGIVISMLAPVARMVVLNRDKLIYSELIVRLIVMLVPVVLTIYICSHFVQSIEYYCDYVTEKYDVISGKLENVEFVHSEGRGDFYIVSFKVNEVVFDDTNISTSIKNAETLKSYENIEVTICYKIKNNQQFVYKIESTP